MVAPHSNAFENLICEVLAFISCEEQTVVLPVVPFSMVQRSNHTMMLQVNK